MKREFPASSKFINVMEIYPKVSKYDFTNDLEFAS
jgi:hypothetical protein